MPHHRQNKQKSPQDAQHGKTQKVGQSKIACRLAMNQYGAWEGMPFRLCLLGAGEADLLLSVLCLAEAAPARSSCSCWEKYASSESVEALRLVRGNLAWGSGVDGQCSARAGSVLHESPPSAAMCSPKCQAEGATAGCDQHANLGVRQGKSYRRKPAQHEQICNCRQECSLLALGPWQLCRGCEACCRAFTVGAGWPCRCIQLALERAEAAAGSLQRTLARQAL